MDEYVDTLPVHCLGRVEDNRMIVQFPKLQHRDGIWRMAKTSKVCETAGTPFTEDVTKEDKLGREKLWLQILQAW